MQAEIIMPRLGADLMVLSVWFADVGEEVFEGDRLIEVVVGGATFDVPAPFTGKLIEKRALPNDMLETQQILGILELEQAPD